MFPRPFEHGPPASHDKGPPPKDGPPQGPRDKGTTAKGPPNKGEPGKGPPGGFDGRPDFEQIQKAEMERILLVLTPEQRTRWQELIGRRFEDRLRMPPPPFKGPGPAPGPFPPR